MESSLRNQERTYNYKESCVFRKTHEEFGGLSNMASGFPIKINGITILTSEALYQACRFPHLPDVQQKIIEQKSPMSAKMVGKPFRNNSRPDWDEVRIKLMNWCLRVKLAQNFFAFGRLLETTGDKPIVEDSAKDKFWGAIKDRYNENQLVGVNVLGRLLMQIRQEYNSESRYNLLYVIPPVITNLVLLQNPIQVVDERQNFIDFLINKWNLQKVLNAKVEFKKFIVSDNRSLEIKPMRESGVKNVIIESELESNNEIHDEKSKKIKNEPFQQDLFSE